MTYPPDAIDASELASHGQKRLRRRPLTTTEVGILLEAGRYNDLLEADYQRWVRGIMKRNGWLCFCTYDSRKSPEGETDLRGIRERAVWIELKAEKGRLSEKQKYARDRLIAAGQEWYCFKPSDWATVLAVLE